MSEALTCPKCGYEDAEYCRWQTLQYECENGSGSITPCEFRQLERDLAEAVGLLKSAQDELTHATWAKGADQRGLKYEIKKIAAFLARYDAEKGEDNEP